MRPKLERAMALLLCMAFYALGGPACYAVQIIDGPNYTLVSLTAAQIQWTTDLPSDSTVHYGTNFGYDLMGYDSNLVTTHVINLTGLAGGGVYDYSAVSAAGTQSDIAYGELVLPDELGYFQLPSSNAIVSGTVQLKVVPGDASIQVEEVDFYYLDPTNGQWDLIGVDTDGTDKTFDSQFLAAPTGDGWSAYWDTTALAQTNTNYTVVALLFSSVGLVTTLSSVYVDQTPPTPTITAPAFGDTVSGTVRFFGRGGGGGGGGKGKPAAVVDVQTNTETNITFTPVSLIQTNYPYDHNMGHYMCDPTAEASVLLSDSNIVNFLKQNTPCRTNSNPDQCIRDYLVHALAQWKHTGMNGTAYGSEDSGTKAALKFLKLAAGSNSWVTGIFPENAATYSVPALKKALKETLNGNPGMALKGMIIHIAPCSDGKATGHVLAVVNINDQPMKSGNMRVYNLQCMDPATGQTITLTVDSNGELAYPPGGSSCCSITGGRVWLGPSGTSSPAPREGPQPLDDSSWQIVGTDTTGNGNWAVNWDASNFAPGLYWARMTVTDALGHSGDDIIEVFIAPQLGIAQSGPNAVVSWPVAPPNNFALETADTLGGTNNWVLATNTVAVTNGQYSVTIPIAGQSQFYRLIQQ